MEASVVVLCATPSPYRCHCSGAFTPQAGVVPTVNHRARISVWRQSLRTKSILAVTGKGGLGVVGSVLTHYQAILVLTATQLVLNPSQGLLTGCSGIRSSSNAPI